MSVNIVLGCQWGDEGKGKIVDSLSSDIQAVARFQGGANAGHTIYRKGEKIVLHQIPSGILQKAAYCFLGHGMVIDPVGLQEELEALVKYDLAPEHRLAISPYATIITPFHKELDRLREEAAGTASIGTTRKGIGPAYADLINREALKAWELEDMDLVSEFLTRQLLLTQKLYQNEKTFNEYTAEIEAFFTAVETIRFYIQDFTGELKAIIERGGNILIEGAQGLLLDLDYGTYPYVTSSHTSSGGIFTGLPINFTMADNVYGVFKAYVTRVGNGPFPTEQFNAIGKHLQDTGFEFGATTGRPRRCGWYDAVLARYGVYINGVNHIVITKLDVLNDLPEIKVAVAYELDGKRFDNVFGIMHRLGELTPVYETLPGWQQSISGISTFEDLPQNTQRYLNFLEEQSACRITHISTGVNREDMICR